MIEEVNKRIESAVADGEQAFWRVVAENFPEAKYGDLSPDAVIALDIAMKEAVQVWVETNVLSNQDNA